MLNANGNAKSWGWILRKMHNLGYIPYAVAMAGMEDCGSRNQFQRAVAAGQPAIEASPARLEYFTSPEKRESYVNLALTVWVHVPGVGSERWHMSYTTVHHLKSVGDRGRAAETAHVYRELKSRIEAELRRKIANRIKADLRRRAMAKAG